MRARAQAVCPICAKDVMRRAENSAYPFCSPSCKLVDLGRWLDGAYKIPSKMSEEDGDGDDARNETSDGNADSEHARSEESE